MHDLDTPGNDGPRRHLVPRLQFSPSALDAPQMQHVSSVLARWAKETGFTKETHVKVATAYAQHCSPPGATRVGIELASEYLAWFLCLNDLSADDYKRSVLEDVRRVVQGESVPARPESVATQIFFNRLDARLGHSNLERFRRRTLQMLDAFLWEVDWLERSPEKAPSTVQYLSQRQHLIAHYPYIELWRVTERVQVEREDLWTLLEQVEITNTRIIFWVNDILSIARDARKGKINLVNCLKNDNGWTPDAAVEHAVGILAQSVAQYLEARDTLASVASADSGIDRHLEFLNSVLEGNRIATVALSDRFWGNA